MLSDEEKETIEQLRSWREYIIKHKEDVNKANDIEFYLRTAINLIEKQSKEIEELKNSDLTTVYLNGFYDGEKKVEDKIKAKIEEVKDGTFDAKIVLQSLLEKE